MRFDLRFPRQVFITLAIVVALAAYPLSMASGDLWKAFIGACVLSTLNALGGFSALVYAEGKPFSTFLKAVLGGMGIRLAGLLGGLLVLITLFHVEPLPLVLFTVGLYTVYLVLEIFFIQRNFSSGLKA